MKRLIFIAAAILVMGIQAIAIDFQTFENEKFSIGIPADWELGLSGDDWMNAGNADNDISFNITYNEQGPTKAQLQEAVDNWVYMKESRQSCKVDQKIVKDDYALVRSITTDEDDGTQTVEVWYVLITDEPHGFSGSIDSSYERADEAVNLLVEMLATLQEK